MSPASIAFLAKSLQIVSQPFDRGSVSDARDLVVAIDQRKEPAIADRRPRLDLAEGLLRCKELLVRENIVVLSGFGKVVWEEIPTGENDIGVIAQSIDREIGQRQSGLVDDALLEQFDSGCHCGADGTADAYNRNSKYALRHKES